MRIIDFHSHFFSRSFFEALAAQAPGDEPVADRLAKLATATGIELPSADIAAHLARWIAQLDDQGVEHLCTFASMPEEVETVMEAVRLAAGRLSGFALVNPRAGATADRLRARMEAGLLRGILLFPAMHHFEIAGSEVERLLHVLDDHEGIVFVHCGLLVVKLRDLLGLPRAYDLAHANPLSLIPAANRFRRVRFVIPHFGAGFFRETLMAGAQCENIYVDTSSSNSWVATQAAPLDLVEVFRRALGVFGPERVIFGTDSGVFPAGWRADRLADQRAALAAAGASAVDQAAVFGGNAARLLRL